jgi:hypothetical protein
MSWLTRAWKAGEDLEEIEEEEEDDDEVQDEEQGYPRASGFATSAASGGIRRIEPLPSTLSVRIAPEASEDSPLLERARSRSVSRRRRRLSSAEHGEHGNATVGQAILMVRGKSPGTPSVAYEFHSFSSLSSEPAFSSSGKRACAYHRTFNIVLTVMQVL